MNVQRSQIRQNSKKATQGIPEATEFPRRHFRFVLGVGRGKRWGMAVKMADR